MQEQSPVDAPHGLISLTASAVEAAKRVRDGEGRPVEQALRVAVVGGGCSGFSYQLNFDDAVRDGDLVLEYPDLTVRIDPTSAEHLQGTQIDFVSSLHGGGFRFTNPQATHTCGCGSSFSV